MHTGKREALTPYEMDEMNGSIVPNNHLYGEHGSERAETISEIVRVIGSDVGKERKKVNLRDTETVKAIAAEYLASCQRIPILPSKSGLCRCLGYSRMGIWLFMRDNYGHPTEDYLSKLFDGFSEAYDIAAMGGTIHPVYTIFTQKAQYGLKDDPPDEIPQKSDPLGPTMTADEIAAKYADLPAE